jgi:hypothetical protein
MTPRQILDAYKAGKRYFPTPLWWLRFLEIADAGDKGVSQKGTMGSSMNERSWAITHKWIRCGLITVREQPGKIGRPRLVFTLGDKGRELLEKTVYRPIFPLTSGK